MNEKVKKYLLSLAVRTAVAFSAAIVIFVLNAFVPKIGNGTKDILTKNSDIQKIGTLFNQLFKEVLP